METNFENLERNFKAKSDAYAHEYQQVFDDCLIKKMKPKQAKREAWAQTAWLREIIVKMPSVQMYFDKLRGKYSSR